MRDLPLSEFGQGNAGLEGLLTEFGVIQAEFPSHPGYAQCYAARLSRDMAAGLSMAFIDRAGSSVLPLRSDPTTPL